MDADTPLGDDNGRLGTVYYSNDFEDHGQISGVIKTREMMGYEMISITKREGRETTLEGGRESLLHFNDVERIDFGEPVFLITLADDFPEDFEWDNSEIEEFRREVENLEFDC